MTGGGVLARAPRRTQTVMTNVDHRNRVSAGVTGGGQFATEAKSEPMAVNLSDASPASLMERLRTDRHDQLKEARLLQDAARTLFIRELAEQVCQDYPGATEAHIQFTRERNGSTIASLPAIHYADGRVDIDPERTPDLKRKLWDLETMGNFSELAHDPDTGYAILPAGDITADTRDRLQNWADPGEAAMGQILADHRTFNELREHFDGRFLNARFDEDGKVAGWDLTAPCGEDGRRAAADDPETAAKLQEIFDENEESCIDRNGVGNDRLSRHWQRWGGDLLFTAPTKY